MNTVRPLVTIIILVVVGAFLYLKINEGKVETPPAAAEAWAQPAESAPPLGAVSAVPATTDSSAPAWPAATPPTAAGPDVTSTATADASNGAPATTAPAAATNEMPAVPAIPEMPEVATTTQSDSAPAAVVAPPLPTDAPPSRYADQSPAAAGPALESDPNAATAAAATAATPPTTPAIPETAPATATTTVEQASATTPEQMNAADAAAGQLASPPLSLQGNPLRPTSDITPPDRYAAAAPTAAADPALASPATPTTTPPTEPALSTEPAPTANTTAATTTPAATTPIAPTGKSFVEDWPAIQGMLDRGELADAHKQLSRWYGDPSLTPTDTERVDTLLSQLAGTVVYSTEHRLGPPHVVKQDETLETIAKQYNVPWQLLAKINSIASPNQVQPGQELKVVRGPFSAVVDLSRNQLTLMVDDRYAGRFPVTVAPGQTITDGEWVVGKKSVEQAPGRALLLQGNATAPGAQAPVLILASQTLPVNASTVSTITLSQQDAEDLTDILSIGSRVVTRR